MTVTLDALSHMGVLRGRHPTEFEDGYRYMREDAVLATVEAVIRACATLDCTAMNPEDDKQADILDQILRYHVGPAILKHFGLAPEAGEGKEAADGK